MKRSNLNRLNMLALAISVASVSGCSYKYGGYTPRSQFIYPNSNVTDVGPVKYSETKTSFFVSPKWEARDAREAYERAVAKVPSANALVNYREDTTYTSIMFFNTMTYTLEGTAVKMTVGKQGIDAK